MKLYFEHSNGSQTLIQEDITKDNVIGYINDDMVRRSKGKFKFYYMRIWTNPSGDTYYDVGSHTEFYVLKEN